jgi:hypothetical protein
MPISTSAASPNRDGLDRTTPDSVTPNGIAPPHA